MVIYIDKRGFNSPVEDSLQTRCGRLARGPALKIKVFKYYISPIQFVSWTAEVHVGH